jgi:hypothetical protein
MSILKKFVLGATASFALIGGAAFASGSEGFSQAPTSDTRLYNTGKGVYADKYSCGGCTLAGKSLNAELAKEILSGKPKVDLSEDEQAALTVYLKRRFRV